MDLATFWELMARAQSPAELHETLGTLPEPELVAFERHHQRALNSSYDWGLWGAASLINGGCGDDTFDDFRAYLLSRGRAILEAALADPDSLAAVELDDEEEWEDWASPTLHVVHARTGEYAFVGEPDPHDRRPEEPTGDEWDEDDLPARFPRLAAKYDP